MLKDIILNEFKGMNRLSSRLNMPKEYAWDISNGYIKKDSGSGLSSIVQRGGIAKFNTVTFTNACKYIFEAKWYAGGTDIIIREGTRWAKFDGTDTFDDLDTGRTDGVRGKAVMFANEMIMTDGGTPRKCTAGYVVSDLSADASMPTDSTSCHVHDHKVWLNSTANPMKAYYSKSDSANAADSWSAADDAGYLDFSHILPNGDTLLGFDTFGENFLIFKFTKFVVVYVAGTDPTAFAIQQIIPLNCVSDHGVKQVGNDLAVTSLEGINSFRSSLTNQDLDLDDLSKHISPLYRELIAGVSDKKNISVEYSHSLNHLYIGLPTTDHTILVYSPEIKNFIGRWTGYKCYDFCERIDGTMLVAGDGYIYTMNTGNQDDGEAISFSYDFPALYFKDGGYNCSVRQLEGVVNHENSPTLGMSYGYITSNLDDIKSPVSTSFISEGVEWDSDEAIWDEAAWAGSSAQRFLNSNFVGRGKGFLLTLSNTVDTSTIEIQYLILRYKREGIKIR